MSDPAYINDFSGVDDLVPGTNTVRAWRAHIAALEAKLEKANQRKANTEWNALVRQSDENLARAEQADDALHSAFHDWRDDFPDSTMEYDEWLACHVTCGKEMRAP